MNDHEIIKGKLYFFFEANKPIYFKLTDGDFRNGNILYIDKEHFILNEVVMGEVPIFFNEIQPSSIVESKSKRLKKEGEDGHK